MVIGSAAPETAILEIAGINAFLVLATLAMANFHHSHIWVSFGPWLEHLIISPAQHQIHHSTRPEHFNKNYGQTLALWDWVFGTLTDPAARFVPCGSNLLSCRNAPLA